MSWAAAIAGAASLGGTLLTNTANAKQAKAQMAFQERMSSTAHQREVADLRKAGLNPILSATGGAGSATPGGAMARMESPGEAVSSALAAKLQQSQIDNIKADTELKGTQRSYTSQLWNTSRAEEARINADTQLLRHREPGARTEAQIDATRYGQGLRYLQRAMPGLGLGSSALRNLGR